MSRRRAAQPYPYHPVRRAAGRGLLRLMQAAAVLAVVVLLAPVTAVAACAFWYGWWRGAPPRRVGLAAAWCAPMVVAWLIAVVAWPARAGGAAAGAGYPAGAGAGGLWFRLAAAPYRAFSAMWQLAGHGHLAAAAIAAAPPAGVGQVAAAISQATTMGPHHAAAMPMRRGGAPRHQPYQNAHAATIVTGASSTASATTAAARTSRSSPRPAARRTGWYGEGRVARRRLTTATRSR